MFAGGFGLFGGSNLPRPGDPPQDVQPKPFWQTTQGKLALAGNIIGNWGKGGTNPMVDLLSDDYANQQKSQFDQQKRQQDWEDFTRQYDYKAAHPAPVNNDTVNDYQFISQTLGADAGKKYLQNKANPPQYRVGPDGQFYPIEVAQPPSAPVGRLTPIPDSPMSAQQGGATLSAASQAQTISQQDAARVRQSLGPNGQAAFQHWLQHNNIVIGN